MWIAHWATENKKMFKKIFLLSFVMCFSISLFAQVYKAIDNHINIRVEPNTNCPVLGQLFFNDEIFVINETANKDWFYCFVPKINNYAYCFSEYFIKDVEKTELYNKYVYSNSDTTSLIDFTRKNDYLIVSYLLTKKECLKDINYPRSQYAPPIFWAIQNGNVKITELLLKNGADPNVRTAYWYTMMEYIDHFYIKGRISKNTANELKELLNKYNYKETDYLIRFVSSPFLEIEKFPNRFFRESEIQEYKDIGYSIEIDEDNHIITIRNERIEVIYCYSNSQREYYMVFLSIIPIEKDYMKNNIHIGISEKSIRSIFDEELFTFSKDVNYYVLSSHKKEDKRDKVFFQFSKNGLERITFVYYAWANYINYNYDSLPYN